MKTYKNKDVYGVLLQKWYIESESHNKDHKRLVYKIGCYTLAQTRISHGPNRDISPKLFSDMARQCHLTRAEFERFIDCTYSAEEYRAYMEGRLAELLRAKGVDQ